MIAPPGRPKTSLIPRCSRDRRIAPDPVSSSGSLPLGARAFAVGTGIDSVDIEWGPLRMVRRETAGLSRDCALRSGVHKLGILRENATGIARRKRSPVLAASFQLCRLDK